MKIHFPALFFPLFLGSVSCQPTAQPSISAAAKQAERPVGGPCECCEAWRDGLPSTLGWQTEIPPPSEPGEPLQISGTIFQNDGKTPAEGIVLYVYHTDAQGNYSRGADISPCAHRHGLLRGWVKTGSDGRYLFRTIRPASYPGTDFEQHIHPTIKEPGLREYWIDEFVFDDDPKLTSAVRERCQQRGGSGIVFLTKTEDGWAGTRDIVLGTNVPGY